MEQQPRDVSALLDRLRRPPRVKFLFFWGHRVPGRGYLSQWWPSPFELSGRTFATAEHYMMWRKALLFDDQAAAEAIARASHPRQAKELGRTVRGFDQQRWEAQRYEIVVAGSVAKFGQNPDLRQFLLGTGAGRGKPARCGVGNRTGGG
ncbi:ribA/ribD-fused uncharacterized protein [Amycolatopsis magusensis]|uniref:RibA/ribD-fused uncharacterized protein n=1 Tax=Amycolatopsis magusensis TaxID=882444 RepID=A0ABS4PXA1_9PSEU|nr:ribA/ribD-fused uncharacterized protein [Amycolatopsis magusensis]